MTAEIRAWIETLFEGLEQAVQRPGSGGDVPAPRPRGSSLTAQGLPARASLTTPAGLALSGRGFGQPVRCA